MRKERDELWTFREYFREDEADNLFFHFTEDHRMNFLWNDEEMNHALEHLPESENHGGRCILWLMQRGFFDLLRRCKQEHASFSEKKRWLHEIEKTIQRENQDKAGRLAYLHSFCNAIDLFTGDETKRLKTQRMIFSVGRFACLAVLALLTGMVIGGLQNNSLYTVFPERHVFAYDDLSDHKLVEAVFRLNRLQEIRFFDEDGNGKALLDDYNNWGTTHFTAYQYTGDQKQTAEVTFDHSSTIPIQVQTEEGDGFRRTINYQSNGLPESVSTTIGKDDSAKTTMLYYSPDGRSISMQVITGDDYTMYSISPEEAFRYRYQLVFDDEKTQEIYTDMDGNVIIHSDSKWIDGKLGIHKAYEQDNVLNGYEIRFESKDNVPYIIDYPSEQVLLAHPKGEKTFDSSGRIIKETWGPHPNYFEGSFIYQYNDTTGILEKIQYYIVRIDKEEPELRKEILMDDEGHVAMDIEYSGDGAFWRKKYKYNAEHQICQVKEYFCYGIDADNQYLNYILTCDYSEQGTISEITVEGKEDVPVAVLKVTNDEIIGIDLL